MVGQYLSELGYSKTDGIDASKGMLAEAEKKVVYRDLTEMFLGNPSEFPAQFHGKYDFVTASGILADNHLDNSVFDEMLLSLKSGGVAIFSTRVEYLTKYGYGEYMESLETKEEWKLLKKDTYFKYDNLENQ